MKNHLTRLIFLCFISGSYTLIGQHTVTGTITDDSGDALFGVNVFEKGTNNGTISDLDGTYSINCSRAEAVLIFSYIGYRTEEVAIGGKTTLDMVMVEGIDLDGIEVVGTRSLNRTVTESPVAIDIIDVKQITNKIGQLEVNQMLQYAAPSFNSNRQSGADGSDHIDPATLRGLGPDQTLVLLNGKRRHQSSNINIFGTRGRGNTGTDLNSIPIAAIERIEVLRDGASAQYGSDAIAGVVNIVMKSSVNEFTGSINAGMFNAKPPSEYEVLRDENFDGESFQVNGNYGVPVGKGGFLNVTADYLNKNRTNRPADPSKYDIYRDQYGDAALENFGTYFNARIPLATDINFYAFGGANYRKTDAFAWTRSADEERNVISIYPNGFNPHITSDIRDRSMSTGIRAKIGKWDADLNNTFGTNSFHYIIDGTLNATLVDKSPTRFDAGGYQFSQNTTGLNLSQYFSEAMSGLNIAFGVEYRIDNYQIFAGEEGSYTTYDSLGIPVNANTPENRLSYLRDDKGELILDDEGNPIKRPGGSQGFPGFQPSNELDEYRTNIGAYVDVEANLSDNFMIGAAVRYENYSDFGDTWNGKLAARLELSKNLALRGSASTGFRAPSLAQIYYNTTFTDFVSGVAIDKIIARNNSPITRALGIPALKEETAQNFSVGLTAKFGSFTATIDGYYVDIKDRVVLTGAFEDTDPDIGADLQKLNVGAAQFFTNAIDTKTTGIDVILTYATKLGSGRLQASLAGNFNDMELGDIHTNAKLAGKEDIYFGRREQLFLLASAPNRKINLTLDYQVRKFNANIRLVNFGEVTLEDFLGTDDVYSPVNVIDLTLGYDLTKNLRLNIGAANLLNTYPTAQDGETESGGLWDAVQHGFSGAFYFAKLGFKF